MALARLKQNPEGSFEPWERAKARFLESFSADEKLQYQQADLKDLDTKTMEELFYSASRTQRAYLDASKAAKVHSVIRPLLATLDEYSPAMDMFSNASSVFLGPIWGSIKVILILANNYAKYFEELLSMFRSISGALPRLRIYEQLFRDHILLQNCLTETYVDIINFCTEVKRALKSSKFRLVGRVLWKPVTQTFSELLRKFENNQAHATQAAEVAHMIEGKQEQQLTRTSRAVQLRDRQAARRRELLRALSPLDWQNKHRSLQSLRHPGTGLWLWDEPAFIHWLNETQSGGFACYGIPGSGKTICANAFVDSILLSPQNKSSRSKIVTHYCDYSDKRSLDVSNILGSLCKQLLEGAEIPNELEYVISQHYLDGDSHPGCDIAKDVFLKARDTVSDLFICIDGLDELETVDRNPLLDILLSLTRSANHLSKVFVTCRQEERRTRKRLEDFAHVDIDPEKVAGDIRSFVVHSIEERCNSGDIIVGSEALKQDIISALTQGAKDMFLWVRFQLEELCEAQSDDHVRRILKDLPKDLAETFARILLRISQSKGGSEKILLARKIFLWIICAQRPLTLLQLKEAVAVEPGDNQLNFDRIPADDGSRLLEACGNLVMLYEADQTVSLVHHAVEQYLLGEAKSHDPVPHFQRNAAECEIGELCLTYLSFSDFQRALTTKQNTTVLINSEALRSSLEVENNPLVRIICALKRANPVAGPERQLFKVDLEKHFKKTDTSRGEFDNYALLPYIERFWLTHTAGLEGNQRQTKVFNSLLNNQRLAAAPKPWKTSTHMHKEKVEVPPDWAVETDHILALKNIGEKPIDLRLRNELLLHACRCDNVRIWALLVDAFGFEKGCSAELLIAVLCASEELWQSYTSRGPLLDDSCLQGLKALTQDGSLLIRPNDIYEKGPEVAQRIISFCGDARNSVAMRLLERGLSPEGFLDVKLTTPSFMQRLRDVVDVDDWVELIHNIVLPSSSSFHVLCRVGVVQFLLQRPRPRTVFIRRCLNVIFFDAIIASEYLHVTSCDDIPLLLLEDGASPVDCVYDKANSMDRPTSATDFFPGQEVESLAIQFRRCCDTLQMRREGYHNPHGPYQFRTAYERAIPKLPKLLEDPKYARHHHNPRAPYQKAISPPEDLEYARLCQYLTFNHPSIVAGAATSTTVTSGATPATSPDNADYYACNIVDTPYLSANDLLRKVVTTLHRIYTSKTTLKKVEIHSTALVKPYR